MIPKENINLRSGEADCIRCDFNFSLSAYELRRLRPQPVEPPMPKPPQSKPKHIKIVEDSEKQLKFGYRWFRWFQIISLLFGAVCLYVFAFLAPETRQLFRDIIESGAGPGTNVLNLLLAGAIVLILWGGGFVAVYSSLAGMVNRTLITANHETLSIHNGLIPIRKNYLFDANQIEQFYVFRSSTTNKGVESTYYDLFVILRNGSQINLLRKLTAEHAWYIEQKLEAFYGLSDRPVNREYRG